MEKHYKKIEKRSMKALVTTTLASSAVFGLHLPAEALTFNFTYDPGTSLQQIVGFETAGNVWASHLTDDVTVNLHVGVSNNLPGNAVGGALPGMQAFQGYDKFYHALNNDKLSADDYTATSNLYIRNQGDTYLRYSASLENGSAWNGTKVSLTNANAKALGLLGNSSGLDGTILMSNLTGTGYQWNYDYSRQGTASAQSLDFLSVALHEIGHTLGFISGIDSVKKSASLSTYHENVDRLSKTTSLDIFRYSGYSDTGKRLDLAAGADTYFSIDRGKTQIAQFAQGTQDWSFGADGFQGSHWQNQTDALGIMGPTIRGGERRSVLGLDLRAMDVIGWNLNSSASIDLKALETQAKQRVAQKIANSQGGAASVSRIDEYLANGSNSTAGSWISGDRTAAIESMISDSKVYEIGYSRWWQEAFWQNAYHSTLEQPDPASVPEPSSLALIGLTAWALKRLQNRSAADDDSASIQ
jgi:hypothetical protein